MQIATMGGIVWDHPLIGGSHNYRGGRFVMEVEKRRVIIAVVILVVVEGVLLPVLVVLEVVTTI